MSDKEWQVIEPVMPHPAWLHGNGGRPEKYCRRLIVDAIRYVVDNGCKWRNLPADFLVPWRTVHAIFTRWWQDGDLYALHNDLREQVRIADGREPEPSAGIIDSQSLRAAETVAAGSRGYDAAKKVQGTKRHVIVDTLGLLLVVIVTAASVQDRDGAKPALARLRDWYERIALIWADSAYAGKLVTWAKKHVRLTVEIVKRSDDVSGFVVLPRILWNLFCQAALIGRGQLGAGSPSRMTLLTTGSKPRTGCSWLPPSGVISTGLPSSLPIARRKSQSVSTPF
ncbi:IS5 family transposase [Nonomuraea helvata]